MTITPDRLDQIASATHALGMTVAEQHELVRGYRYYAAAQSILTGTLSERADIIQRIADACANDKARTMTTTDDDVRYFKPGDKVCLVDLRCLHDSLEIGDVGEVLTSEENFIGLGPHHEVRFDRLGKDWPQSVGIKQMRLVESRATPTPSAAMETKGAGVDGFAELTGFTPGPWRVETTGLRKNEIWIRSSAIDPATGSDIPVADLYHEAAGLAAGQEAVAWQVQFSGSPAWCACSENLVKHYASLGLATRALYTTPQPSHETELLAGAIRNAAVKAGICREDAALTGPHLLMLCDDLAAAASPQPSPAPSGDWVMVPRELLADALDKVQRYAETVVQCVKADDLEFPHYVPCIEETADDLREVLAAAPPSPPSAAPGAQEGYKLRDYGFNEGPWTYQRQPGNVGAWAIGTACRKAMEPSAGDPIDRGLILLRELQAEGFGVYAIGVKEPAAAPPEASASKGGDVELRLLGYLRPADIARCVDDPDDCPTVNIGPENHLYSVPVFFPNVIATPPASEPATGGALSGAEGGKP